MKVEQTECFETSAYKIQTPENYPEESIQVEFFFIVSPCILIHWTLHTNQCTSIYNNISV